jgi:CRP/FNR family transcriptional regulator, cyclic AMP receptor protein
MNPWFIRDTGFSRRISPEDRAVFMRVCPERRYPKGSAVFRTGDPATHLHVVAAGQVKLTALTPSGNERILAVCGPDDFIGEAFLREAEHYRSDAVALTDAVTCPMSRAQFMQLGLRAPTFIVGFTEILAGNLLHCREQLSTAYDPIKLRVVKVLLEQTRRFGRASGPDGWHQLDTALKHEEIAAMTSATRVSVTMAMSELRAEGLLEGSRGRYRLFVPALAALLEQGE